MSEQHYRITLSKAIAHYQVGDLTAKGLLHFYFKIRIAPDWTLKETPKQICKKLGIQKSAFYNGISRLKAEGSLSWEVPESTKFSFTLPFRNCGNPSTIAETVDISKPQPLETNSNSSFVSYHSAIAESPSAIAESPSAIAESPSAIAENESTKPLLSEDSRSSSDFFSDFSSDCVSSGTHTHAETKKPEPEPEPELPENSHEETETIPNSLVNFQNSGEDKSSAAPEKKHTLAVRGSGRIKSAAATATAQSPGHILYARKMELSGQRPIVRRPKFLYPEGEWLDERGRLNGDFIRWMAKRWKSKFKDNAERPLEEILADVCSYFANQPEKVAIQWDAYCAIAHRKAEMVEQRAAAGMRLTSVDAREYALAAAANPTNPNEAATDFSIESVAALSPQTRHALESAGHVFGIGQSGETISGITPGVISGTTSPTTISKATSEKSSGTSSGTNSGTETTPKTEKNLWDDPWESSHENASKFSNVISTMPKEPPPVIREGYQLVNGQIEPAIGQGAYKPAFDYLTVEAIAHESKKATEITDMSEEQRAENCRRIGKMIQSLTKKKSMSKSPKSQYRQELEQMAEITKKAEAELQQTKKTQYQLNASGYFIDKEGEF